MNLKTPTDQAWDDLCSQASASVVAPKIPAVHPFAKLGDGPWRFEGVEHATTGGRHCALCGKSIKNLYIVSGADRFPHSLGSECILGMSNGFEAHLVGQVKTAKKRYEKAQRAASKAKREAKETAANLEVSLREHRAECEFLHDYKGSFDFHISLRNQLHMRGALSDRQWECITRAIEKQKTPVMPPAARVYSLKMGTVLIVTKFLALVIGRDSGLNRPHFAIEVVEVLGESLKAYHIVARLTAHRTSHCCVCGFSLTNSVSVAAGIGPICAGRYNVSTTEELQAKLQTEYKTEIKMWIPKSQIKERKEAIA